MDSIWTISGVVIAVLALLVAYMQLIRTPKKMDTGETGNLANFNNSQVKDSNVNNIQGENISINQTIINNIKETDSKKEVITKPAKISVPEFERNKKIVAREKNKVRTYIYAVLTSAKAQKLLSKIEIRHIQDVIEELYEISNEEVLEELKLLKEENIIQFNYKKDEVLLSPYTNILVTHKFYGEIE